MEAPTACGCPSHAVRGRVLAIFHAPGCLGVPAYPYVWFWRARHGERKGMRCRVWARGTMNSIGVEFEDGFRTVTSRYAVRRLQREGNGT